MTLVDVERLREIAEVEFADIVAQVLIPDLNELRIILTDGSFMDVWFSLKLAGRYSYHWERRAVDGAIYRHDNAPHKRWRSVATFPRHFHNASEPNVVESHLSEGPEESLREFLALCETGQISYTGVIGNGWATHSSVRNDVRRRHSPLPVSRGIRRHSRMRRYGPRGPIGQPIPHPVTGDAGHGPVGRRHVPAASDSLRNTTTVLIIPTRRPEALAAGTAP